MWLPLTILVLVGAVAADFEHAWRPGKEYHYLVRSRTLTGLDDLAEQFSGVLMKGVLTVQPQDSQTLRAKLSKPQYAHVHKIFDKGRDEEIPDHMLELRDMPMTGKPFEIKMEHGVIRHLVTERDVPTWEVNMLKGIVSQFQVDTLGENAMKSSGTQAPTDEQPFATFRSMEDTVGGKCETTYDITPLHDYVLESKPELVPLPHLKEDEGHIDIIKTKNYSRCDQRVDYHFGITGKTNWEPGSNFNGQFLTRSSIGRVVISGNLKRFTIQSSVTVNDMFVSPRLFEPEYPGVVRSKMNLTLVSVKDMSSPLPTLSNPESVGNLVYTYNNPFSEEEQRRLGRLSSPHDAVASDSGSLSSVSSSEEAQRNRVSSSSSASSSSISSSEEAGFWQPKPTLEDAPQFPLLPLFAGINGKAIGTSNKINPVQATKDLVQEISTEMDDPSSIPPQQTLEKFTILISLIRTMSRKQIEETEKSMHLSPNQLKGNDKSLDRKQNVWATFRDAVTEAGTGPALLTVKDWIENRKVEGLEAAEILSRLPKNARTPTAEYIDALFELVKSPTVQEQTLLNSTAMLAFTELVRFSQISNSSIHNRYPVHSFGRLSSKHNQAVLQRYIPFLAEQLRNAIKDGDSPRIQTYIVALGNIGHPKILSVFEPYLEGKKPVSTFQRTMMVAALSKLAELHPRLTRSVLYKIYLNTMDVHDVRCVAVYLLMKTDPPLTMLQRMAEFTKYDPSKHVKSAVVTTLRSIARLTRPETRDLAAKANAVIVLLSPHDYQYQYSQGYVTDSTMGTLDLAYRLIVNYVGSDDSVLARAWYIGVDTSYGGFRMPAYEMEMMISSVRALSDMLSRDSGKKESTEKTHTEKIAEILNIETEDPVQIEGHSMWNSMYGIRAFFFDNHTIERIPLAIAKHLASFKNGGHFNMNRMMSYEMTLSFPTESGLPFVYSLKIPSLTKIQGDAKIHMAEPYVGELQTEVRMTKSKKFQGRMGFVTPFDHQQFSAGVDLNVHGYLPLKVESQLNILKKSLELKLWPIKGEKNARVMHFSVIPYTSRHDILTLRPVSTDKNTQKVMTDDIFRMTDGLTGRVSPVKLITETDGPDRDTTIRKFKDDPLAMIALPWTRMTNKYNMANILVDFDSAVNEPITIKVMADSMQVNSKQSDSDDSAEWDPKMMDTDASGLDAASDERRKQYLKEAAGAITNGKAHVVDARLIMPGKTGIRSALTVAWAKSNIDDKNRVLLFLQLNLPENNVKREICIAGNTKSNIDYYVDFETALNSKPKIDFDADVRFGDSCLNGEQIELNGQFTRSVDRRAKVRESREAKLCQEQMKEGNKGLRTCLMARDEALEVDELEMSVDLHNPNLQKVVASGLEMIRDYKKIESHVTSTRPINPEDNKVDFKVWFDDKEAIVAVRTSSINIIFPSIEYANGLPENEAQEALIADGLETIEGTCVLDTTKAETFDGHVFPVKLGNCWHVLMTTYPKENSANPKESDGILEDMMVSIVSRDVNNGREVKIILGNDEVLLSANGAERKATMNGKKIPLSQTTSFQRKDDRGDLMFEIIETRNGMIRLMSEKYDIHALYDGKRLVLKVDDKYQSAVRGVCGNFNGEVDDDFSSPKNCWLKNPEEFVASYALTNDQCDGPAVDIARRLQKSECKRKSIRISNVINDFEAGRVSRPKQNWGYHANENEKGDRKCNTFRTQVVEVDNKICFSTRPAPACAPECRATETKSKNYQFHCMERSEAALEMKKRVEKGANPDLSQKVVSLSKALDIPLECRA